MSKLSVAEVSQKMNKSKSTIYTYLKQGKLKGEKNNGVWEIEPINSNVTNKDVFVNELRRKANESKEIAEEIKSIGSKKMDINKRLMRINGWSGKALSMAEYLNNNEMYKSAVSTEGNYNKKLKETIENYKEFENIIEDVNIIDIVYSNTSESVYVNLCSKSIVKFLNRLSELNKRFFIINDEFMTLKVIKVRFSNHIPDYYKETTISIINDDRKVDIIVPFSELENNITSPPKLQSEADKKAIRKVNVKIGIAKKYSSTPMKNLSIQQLKEYDELSTELLNDRRTKNIGFVRSLQNKQRGIKNLLKKRRQQEAV